MTLEIEPTLETRYYSDLMPGAQTERISTKTIICFTEAECMYYQLKELWV
jgi:hypothetical protein